MKKCVLVPDSFKGTLASKEVCDRMASAIQRFFPEAAVISLPVADGGEGTVDAFLSALPGGEKVCCTVSGPFGCPVESFYGRIGSTAVVEMAAAAGLPLAKTPNPEEATTYGVGELISHALENGAEKIILGLGGSATNDGGCGAAAALGAKFYHANGQAFVPVGKTLQEIEKIDLSALKKRLEGVEMVAMCDIDNPLCGERGAAAVFAPQKGADGEMVKRLDAGLAHLASVIHRELGVSVLDVPGAGAAGGMGAGAMALLGARLCPGIDAVLDAAGFEAHLEGADVVFTGEGRLDGQTLGGKVISGVARRAKQKGVPVVVVAGDVSGDVTALYKTGVAAIFSTNREARPFAEVRNRAGDDLSLVMENILRLWKLSKGR